MQIRVHVSFAILGLSDGKFSIKHDEYGIGLMMQPELSGLGGVAYIRRSLSHPPWATFHTRYLHSWNYSVGAEKAGVGKHLAESFPKTYRFDIGTLFLACRAIALAKPTQGVWYLRGSNC